MRDPVLKFRQLRILCQDGAREFSWGEMEKTFERRSSKDRGSLTAAGNTYKTFDNAVRSLQGGVKESLGLRDKVMLTGEVCDKLFDSGLVRQFVLLPYRTAGLQ